MRIFIQLAITAMLLIIKYYYMFYYKLHLPYFIDVFENMILVMIGACIVQIIGEAK